uniref:Vacuolar protein sorting-associated protein 11 homolog n=1 Tax=Strigamia maritima TaxID=126957 RepID=T1ISE0_STRMM
MAFLQVWRRFKFFDKEVVKDGNGQIFDKLKDISITACTSGRGLIILGDVEGIVYYITRQLELISFKAYELTVNNLQQLRQNNILVSTGEDVPGNNPVIKIWNFDKCDKNGLPLCTRSVTALPGNKETPATALAVHENMNFMALGYDNGSVLLFRGDISRDRGSKHKILHEGPNSVTNLAFRNTNKIIHLFVSTTEEIYCYNIHTKDKDFKYLLEDKGCLSRCSTMSDATLEYQFVVARTDAVYFYQPDGRGPCFAFDGKKIILHWFRGYLVAVGKDGGAPSGSGGQSLAMNIVTVYDIQNKFIAYSAPLPEVIDVVSEWGSLYVLGGDKKLYHLQEKDTQSKLDMLFKKSLYALAIELAKSQQYDEDGVVDIFRQYGDHLYSKGDHDGAIEQYIKTIGKLEASYVIRKFLDAQRIHNLTAYLQALHKQGLATEDHTTLLLNCYTKLKDTDKLNEFIKTKDGSVDFNVEIAIRVCRQACYYRHALLLSEKEGQHDWYLKIQIEDLQDYQTALSYISKLDFIEAESNMKKYGKMLMTIIPNETTQFLKQLCTDFRPSNKPLVDVSMLDGSKPMKIERAEAKDFIHIFVNNSKHLVSFLEHTIKIPLYPAQHSSLVYNTLIELYLQEYNQETEDNLKIEHEIKILNLLQSPDSGYDLDQVLVLCQMNNFKPGILYLYEKAKLFQQILRYYMDRDDFNNVINTCKHFGSQDSKLWIQALWYFSKTDDRQKNYLIEILQHIERERLLSPLMVVNTLASSSLTTLAVIKDYIIKQLQKENQQIAEDEAMIKQYRDDTGKMRKEIEDIKHNPREFKVAKCSACNQQLELPSVHFLCHHSYHMHCFESYAENENECPACMPENRKVLEIIKAQEENRELHEIFHHQLEVAEDGFSVVSEYFGRGIFNRVTLVTEALVHKRPPSLSRIPIVEPARSIKLPPVERLDLPRNSKIRGPMSLPSSSNQLLTRTYPKTKNPFEAGAPNPFESAPNPFEDPYDDSLNPFES